MGVSNMTLVKIGAVGGILTVTMGMALRNKIINNIRQTEYYKDALQTVRTNTGVVHLLGEPIKEGRIDIGNEEKNFTKENIAQYEIPIKGPKENAKLYFWANKGDEKWVVNRIEIGLESDTNRRLLIKNIDKTK